MERDIRLTRELADQIVFGMENQAQEYYLDLNTQAIVPAPPDLAKADAGEPSGAKAIAILSGAAWLLF